MIFLDYFGNSVPLKSRPCCYSVWVRTDMGEPNGLISTEQSVTGMRQVISNLISERLG